MSGKETTETVDVKKLPKIKFICDLEDGVHWKLYLDEQWKGDFLHLEAAVKHIYSITGEDCWGERLQCHNKGEKDVRKP